MDGEGMELEQSKKEKCAMLTTLIFFISQPNVLLDMKFCTISHQVLSKIDHRLFEQYKTKKLSVITIFEIKIQFIPLIYLLGLEFMTMINQRNVSSKKG